MQRSRLALLLISATLATPSALAQLASVEPAGKPASEAASVAPGEGPARPAGTASPETPRVDERADAALLPTLDDPISTSESSEGIVIETRRGGWRYAYLRGRFMHFMMRRLHADGSSSLVCSDHPGTDAAAAGPRASDPNWFEK